MSIDLRKIQAEQSRQLKAKQEAPQNSIMELLNRDFSFSKGLTDKKKERLYAEVSILLDSGIDIKTALEIALDDKGKKKDRELVEQIKNAVIKGGSLSDAIKETGLFSDYEYYSLRIGEESGRVTSVLKDLSSYYARKIEQRRKVINTFSYPFIVFFVAIAAVVFMLNFIVPMFRDVFQRFGGELPALTQLILKLSDALAAYGGYVLLIVGAIVIILLTQRKKEWYRKAQSNVVLRIPFVNELVRKVYLARFSHSMHLLTIARNPLLNSIQLVRNMVGFYPLEKALEQIEKEVLRGASLNKSMEKHTIFNRKLISLVKVGEEVNQLDVIFHQIDEQYVQEIEYQTEVIGNLVEPILIIFIGGFVAVILVAMYLPLFQLGTSVF